MVQTIMYETI